MDDTTLQKLLRDQLPTLAEPTAPPSGAAQRVRDAVTGRRRRRRVALGAGAGGAAFALLLPLAIALSSGGDDSTEPIASDDVGGWHQIAESPLSPRAGSASIWTGREMIVAGGDVAPPCPPTADCVGPTPDELRADGAAYDPDADTWRSIATAPVPFTNPTTSWSGHEMIVLTERHTLAYNPTTDAWRELDPPPAGYLIGGEWDGDDLVFWQSEERAGWFDWSLDPSSGRWTKLPADPFGSTFDRAYVWVGDRYVFLALPTEGGDAKTFQVAEYDPATRDWQRRPASHIGFGGVDWFFHQGYVVNPYEDPRFEEEQPTGGAYDPATGRWVATPESGHYIHDGCQLGPIGSVGDWLAPAGGVLYSADPADTVVAPDCPQLPEPAAAVSTGQQVIIWGGPDRDRKANTAVGLAWTPPRAGD